MSASGTLRTCKQRWRMSALRGRADMTRAFTISAYNPERTSRTLKARAACLAFTPVWFQSMSEFIRCRPLTGPIIAVPNTLELASS